MIVYFVIDYTFHCISKCTYLYNLITKIILSHYLYSIPMINIHTEIQTPLTKQNKILQVDYFTSTILSHDRETI